MPASQAGRLHHEVHAGMRRWYALCNRVGAITLRTPAMRMLQSLLFATDFRPASRAAEQVAVRLASVFGSRVAPLHVLEPLPGWPVALHEQNEQVRPLLDEVAGRLAGAKVEVAVPRVVVAPAADAILRAARETDADLILIGAGEQSPHGQFRAGPVAEAVVQQADAPVLAVRPGEPGPQLRTLLCPVDLSAASRQALDNAVRLAGPLGARLVVLTVVPEVGWLSAATASGRLAGAREQYAQAWREDFQRFVQKADWSSVPWTPEVRYGQPHEQIAAAARDHAADLLVMGSTGRSGLVRVLLGSTTRRVLRELPCSLLVVKGEDVVEETFEEDVRHVEVLLAEGRGLLEAGSFEQAAVRFRQALARDPFHPGALGGLAAACDRMGRQEEAERCRRRLRRLGNERDST
jgi:nucleotide-binding universal stress UspA family protein